MALLAKDKGGSDIKPMPTGMHQGICYGVVDIGTQPAFGKFGAKRKVVILFEFPQVRIELPDKEDPNKKNNLPRALSIKETLSLSERGNLRPILESWRGRAFTEAELKGFDLEKVIGANALINVVHEVKADRTYANIASINPLAQGMKRMTNELPPLKFSFDDLPPTGDIARPANMPDWIWALIMQSDEYIRRSQKTDPSHAPHEREEQQANIDEDVPF